jgi:hypothetical protein
MPKRGLEGYHLMRAVAMDDLVTFDVKAAATRSHQDAFVLMPDSSMPRD